MRVAVLRRVRIDRHAADGVFDSFSGRGAAAVIAVGTVVVVVMVMIVLGHGTLPWSLLGDAPIGPTRIPVWGICLTCIPYGGICQT